MNNEIGKRAKLLRKEKNLTQQQIADMLEIDQSNYSKYELGKLEINNEMLIKLAKYFNVTAGQLLGTEEL